MNNPLFIGKVLHEIEKLASTNEYALKVLTSKEKPAEGTVISTYHQSSGRGQMGSFWESEPGRNLSFSVILYPNFLKATEQALFNQAIALACRSWLAQYTTKPVEVKWPNDIMVDGKKIIGILIQNSISAHQLYSSIVGIGVNVNQKQFLKAPNPISLALLNNRFYDLDVLRLSLWKELEKNYLFLKAGNYQAIKEQYLCHLYRYGEVSLFSTPDQQLFEATVVGITNSGKLQLKTSTGTYEYGIKEIQFK